MYKLITLLVVIAVSTHEAAGIGKHNYVRRCTRAVGLCRNANGTVVKYDTCTQVCCGKEVYDKLDSFSQCCGDKSFGRMHNPETEICCAWAPTLDFEIHNRTENSPTEPECCGADLYDNEENPHMQCCRSWQNKPEAFNTLTSMCCEGRVGFITTTAYADCCYDVAYDRRVASCPCGNGKLLNAQKKDTACCRFDSERSNWNPYLVETQGCCDGEIYDLGLQICCNGLIANASSQYCCNGLLTDQQAGNEGNVNIGCCTVGGIEQAFDATTQTCCGDELVDRENEGDECCAGRAYFSEAGNCCNNTVYDLETEGAGCCAGTPYDELTGVCCGGGIVGSDMVWPACCGTDSFDAYEQTCCGTTVFDNPPDSRGETSHHTRCCGDFGDPSTLVPYDYDSQTCCGGVNASLTGEDGKKIGLNDLECCGEMAMNRLSHLCCDDVVNRNLYKEFGRCVGNTTYDIRIVIYCDDVRLDNPFGADGICCGPNVFNGAEFPDTKCCGDSSMDADAFKCCDGTPRELGGIPKEKAVCCGNSCIDGRDYWCCEGKAYWKGENNEDVGELIDGMACSEFFKQSVRDRAGTRGTGRVISGGVRVGRPQPVTTTTEAPTTPAPPPPVRGGRRPGAGGARRPGARRPGAGGAPRRG
ncbi:uncharacterized protein LOC120344879 [Styela clava]